MEDKVFSFSDEEQSAMRRLSVAALVLFGSHAQGTTSKRSDYDIGILVSSPTVLNSREVRREIYDALYDILSEKINGLVDIDIVFLEAAPAELKAHVMKYGKVIFEADTRAFPDFKQRTMLECADFAPLRRIFEEGVLAQIS